MKKFSNITNQVIGQEPKIEYKLDESQLFKVKVISLMEQFLSIRTYGPVDRYLREGSIKISGQELLAEAILSLFDEKAIKEQSKLLESLKSDIKDWETIDNKIDDLNSKMIGDKFKTQYKVNSLLEKYDDDTLIEVLESKLIKVNTIETLEVYLETFNKTEGIKQETLQQINKIYTDKIQKLKDVLK
jgi:hypothetical protein